MPIESAITVRMPTSLRRQLEDRAQREHRSLSRQIVVELAAALGSAPALPVAGRPRLLGMFKDLGLVPVEQDFADLSTEMTQKVERRLRKSASSLGR